MRSGCHYCGAPAGRAHEVDCPIFLNQEVERPDVVNKPPHYRAGDIECIDAIRAALTPEEFRGFLKGNVIKYTWREKHKNGNEDLNKAVFYLRLASGDDPRKTEEQE